ncbi:MAG: hypothetical protein K9K81_06185 [Desulfobacteraceae bacterium]|nr:hypothetical protein [Desulfobacteraceae bacterium]
MSKPALMYDGIVGTHDSSAVFAAIIAQETGHRFAPVNARMKYPEVNIRHLIHENAHLSDFKHNPESYRYAVVDCPETATNRSWKNTRMWSQCWVIDSARPRKTGRSAE